MQRINEIAIVVLQGQCFWIRIRDSNYLDVDPTKYLSPEVRSIHVNFQVLSKQHKVMMNFEGISLLFMALKLADFLRKLRIVNIILLVTEESKQYVLIFIIIFLVLNLTLVPLAQAIWGIHFFGYKTYEHAVTSVIMINYAKGNLNELLDYNPFWSFIFIFFYYMFISFLIHAAFHSA